MHLDARGGLHDSAAPRRRGDDHGRRRRRVRLRSLRERDDRPHRHGRRRRPRAPRLRARRWPRGERARVLGVALRRIGGSVEARGERAGRLDVGGGELRGGASSDQWACQFGVVEIGLRARLEHGVERRQPLTGRRRRRGHRARSFGARRGRDRRGRAPPVDGSGWDGRRGLALSCQGSRRATRRRHVPRRARDRADRHRRRRRRNARTNERESARRPPEHRRRAHCTSSGLLGHAPQSTTFAPKVRGGGRCALPRARPEPCAKIGHLRFEPLAPRIHSTKESVGARL